MREVILQIPTFESEQNIDIDVKINGKKRTMHYRVEIIDWENDEETTEEKISVLRRVIDEREKDWELIQIGAPLKNNIPITFRKRSESDQQNPGEE
ncbi:MAG: hypothetical protein MUP98_19350 [Candidatus Aminicenantes bacterium]|nr:hypothetical protein [Candidatus Aminicenantes bacterium]